MRALIDEHPNLGVEPVLRELHIPSSTYYRWCQAEKEPCEHRRRDAELAEHIRKVYQDSGGIYGSPRVHAVLKREGVRVGRKRVERLMRQAGLAGISPRSGVPAASAGSNSWSGAWGWPARRFPPGYPTRVGGSRCGG
ncbi:IS3 family transposase [Streptomyces sp. NPDC058451]|uniref:IS3 family transposase n=1 Tax=Streptomyces sp. NPDC058451 TaxID=3346506 RepID=UPI00364798BD